MEPKSLRSLLLLSFQHFQGSLIKHWFWQVSSSLEKAEIVCIYKSGDISNTTNYRPISLLPLLSKVLERHMAISLNSYSTKFTLLSDFQSGFRRSHSCQTALLKLTQDCYNSLNKKELVVLASLDFRKAFEFVSSPILLKKLQIYKFSSKSLDWFNSYLSEHSQSVSFKSSRPLLRTLFAVFLNGQS